MTTFSLIPGVQNIPRTDKEKEGDDHVEDSQDQKVQKEQIVGDGIKPRSDVRAQRKLEGKDARQDRKCQYHVGLS